jgi:hypothetical protein
MAVSAYVGGKLNGRPLSYSFLREEAFGSLSRIVMLRGREGVELFGI